MADETELNLNELDEEVVSEAQDGMRLKRSMRTTRKLK